MDKLGMPSPEELNQTLAARTSRIPPTLHSIFVPRFGRSVPWRCGSWAIRSAPRVSRSYLGGRNNGAGAGGAKKPAQGGKIDVDADIAEAQARFEANCEAIRKMIRYERNQRRLMIGSFLAGLPIAWVITAPGGRFSLVG
ncbi:hypothetical protein BS78_02G029600 [Paspalum vaginatum]|nr:hypothetical protein BS78_02G029600 [Paspalum vaginatum]